LIEALAEAKKDGGPMYNLVLVGDGIVRSELEELVSRNGLDEHVWFYGACYEEDRIAELVYNAELVVSPGNVGLTVIHALGYGTPVITHDNFSLQMPEFEAVVPGETGAFFQQGNPESLVDTIRDWFQQHPKKNQQIIERCWAVIDAKYNPSYQIKVLADHLGLNGNLKAR
jgi:glycosyltransferase involved in cell wall biosynthesis